MRRPVRPFVKEFKHRSSKAAPRSIAPIEEGVEPKPNFLDFTSFVQRANGHEDGYEAALKAADMVFGKKLETTPLAPANGAEPSPSPAPIGRVLPSLIEIDVVEAIEEPPIVEKKVRKPRVARVKTAEAPAPKPAPRVTRPRTPKVAEAPVAALERPVIQALREQPDVSAPRRTRRPIQLRWVLQTALRAGEKWKRRLPEPAR